MGKHTYVGDERDQFMGKVIFQGKKQQDLFKMSENNITVYLLDLLLSFDFKLRKCL